MFLRYFQVIEQFLRIFDEDVFKIFPGYFQDDSGIFQEISRFFRDWACKNW